VSLRLARRVGDLAAALDPAADVLQAAAKSLPKPVRNVLDGVWLGAPLHPALTDVPLGSWSAAATFDAIDLLRGEDSLADAADAALALGVLAVVPAALSGINDWSYLRGDSKRVGTVHALVNTTGLVLNIASLALRRSGSRDLGRLMSGVAYGGALFAAHLGGELSFGLGVRVNRTAFESPEHEWKPVADETDLEGGAMKRVEIDGEPALVTRAANGRVCAIAARCSHLGGPLDEGERDGDVVTCPWHGSQFDVCTGEVVAGPAVFPQPVYESRVSAGRIELRPLQNT
jgi:nitrite reductase/ring-hydroxylating ferredoxin subunit